jgi:hypothetical protein
MFAIALPTAAMAAPGQHSVPSCQVSSSLSQPFAAWGDLAQYALVPGGDGSLTGWTLQAGATQTAGGPFDLSASLSLPKGAVATAPAACVNVPHPDARFFLQGSPGASVRVEAVYDIGKAQVAIPVGPPWRVQASASWQPSPAMEIHPTVIPALYGGAANITLRFVGTGGTVQIDDVYVDPWRSG